MVSAMPIVNGDGPRDDDDNKVGVGFAEPDPARNSDWENEARLPRLSALDSDVVLAVTLLLSIDVWKMHTSTKKSNQLRFGGTQRRNVWDVIYDTGKRDSRIDPLFCQAAELRWTIRT